MKSTQSPTTPAEFRKSEPTHTSTGSAPHHETKNAVRTAKSSTTSGYETNDGDISESERFSGYLSSDEDCSDDQSNNGGYDEVTVKVRPGSNKERVGLVSGFSFRKALYDSYNNASNLFGSQFVVDMKRCTWHVNGDTLSAQKLSDSLDAWRTGLEKLEVMKTMSGICRENYGVNEEEFLQQFSDRVCAAMALLGVIREHGAEGCVPSPRLIDEIVSHCHQGGFSAWTYMDIIVPFQFALDDAYFAYAAKQDPGLDKDLLSSSRFTSAHAIDIKKHVYVSTGDSLKVVENLKFLVRCPDASEHVPNFVVDVGLECKMSAKPNGIVHYTDCFAKVTIHAPPGCTIDAEPNILFRILPCLTKIMLYIINWIKGLGLCTPKDERTPAPTLYHVDRSAAVDGGTVVELSYSIPPVSTRPKTFFSEIMSRTGYHKCSENTQKKSDTKVDGSVEPNADCAGVDVPSTIESACTTQATAAESGIARGSS